MADPARGGRKVLYLSYDGLTDPLVHVEAAHVEQEADAMSTLHPQPGEGGDVASAMDDLKLPFPVQFLRRPAHPPDIPDGRQNWRPGNPIFDLVIAYFRKREKDYFRESDAIVSLTDAGAAKVKERTATPVTVIPCCVDFDHFRLHSNEEQAAARRTLGIPADARVLAYLGSINERMLVGDMLKAFRAFDEKEQKAIFLVIAPEGEASVRAKATELGLDPAKIVFRSCRRDEVPAVLSVADAGIAFYRPSAAMAGCSPTKLGEMLALGLPVLVNSGIGDVDEIMGQVSGGTVAASLEATELAKAVARLDESAGAPERIRAEARRWFDLAGGVSKYDSLYRSLAKADRAGPSRSE